MGGVLFGWKPLTDFHKNEAIFFFEKKIKMDNSKKLSFSKSPILNIFVKILWIGPWVSRIDGCEGH